MTELWVVPHGPVLFWSLIWSLWKRQYETPLWNIQYLWYFKCRLLTVRPLSWQTFWLVIAMTIRYTHHDSESGWTILAAIWNTAIIITSVYSLSSDYLKFQAHVGLLIHWNIFTCCCNQLLFLNLLESLTDLLFLNLLESQGETTRTFNGAPLSVMHVWWGIFL